ncbi:MAG: hypothetical protein ABIH23_09475 [bacterium]
MKPVATKLLLLSVAISALLGAVPRCAGQQSVDRSGPIFFVGLVGEHPSADRKVLLRWYSASGEIPFTAFSLYRKPGAPHDPGSFSKLAITGKLRNIPLIRSIFERPGEEEIFEDILDVLNAMSDVEITKNTYVQRLLEMLGSEDCCQETCDACTARAALLAESNYGVAIVQGLGYLDIVPSGTYTYELRTTTGQVQDDLLIGRITIDASTITRLPPPEKCEEVEIGGIRGDRKVFLRWDISPDLADKMPLNFGFNVYRYNGFPAAGDTFHSLEMTGLLTKVNRLPIMLNSKENKERPEEEQYDFVDDNLSFDAAGRLGTHFNIGDQLTYWVAARDLLGRHGIPTDPVRVIVQDRRAPAIPRGLRAIEERIGSNRRIVLEWNSNADGDTVAYRLYRYKYYHHFGRPGPFDEDEDGDGTPEYTYTIPEGLIAAVPEPTSATAAYRDTQVGLPDDEGRAYWYCVAAVDAAGNRSPLSVPVRGVLFDRNAPDPPKTIQICTIRYKCDATFRKEKVTSIKDKTVVVFNIERLDQGISATRVVRRDEDKAKPSLLFQGDFGNANVINVTDTVRIKSESINDDLTYYFSFKTPLGDWCGPFELPADLRNELIQRNDSQVEIRVQVRLRPEKVCRDATLPGRVPHDPVAGGGVTPLEVTVTLTDDAVGASLYRSVGCTDYHRVASQRAEEGASTVTLVDSLRPGSTAAICYGVRLFDENNNLSGMTYLESLIIFAGDETVSPSIDTMTAAGSEASPEVRIRWFGPQEGMSGYRIYFATGGFAKVGQFGEIGKSIIGSATGVSSIHPLDSLSYSQTTGIWTAQLSHIDDSGSHSLETNTAYRIWVDGVDLLGNTIEGKNTKLFTWTIEETIEERLTWPVRPLPEKTTGLPISTKIPDADYVIRGVALQITDPDWSVYQEVNPLEILVVNTPFLVYRKRVDISDQPYVQIGPLIREIQTDGAGLIHDPFIRAFGVAAYYMDYIGLVHKGWYQYVVVELDDRGELSLVRSPTDPVMVDFE